MLTASLNNQLKGLYQQKDIHVNHDLSAKIRIDPLLQSLYASNNTIINTNIIEAQRLEFMR